MKLEAVYLQHRVLTPAYQVVARWGMPHIGQRQQHASMRQGG
jgi:hypothetical protein